MGPHIAQRQYWVKASGGNVILNRKMYCVGISRGHFSPLLRSADIRQVTLIVRGLVEAVT